MKLSMEGRLRSAIHCTFVVGAASMLAVPTVHADDKEGKQITGVEITGSRIRRVDTETADTVQVLDRKQIAATGAATLGQLLQSIPSVSGTPYNAGVNNGGGTGEASVDLRGLGAKRTLILLDGQRLNSGDVNSIPSNMIERIEVLKEGAAAVYGTDAIGGVVNFITRKTFTGIEAELSGGTTEKGDGSNGDIQLTWGTKMGSGSAVFGASFNRQNAIKASDRATSNAPWGLYYGQNDANAWTSSRGPGGRFKVPGFSAASNPLDAECPVSTSANYVTLIDGASGTQTSDYRRFCSNLGPGYSDRYNYQTENLALTPSKRMSFFGIAQEPINENIKWVASGTFTNTQANAQLAAEPFDTSTIQGTYPGSKPTLSSASIYNPFGTDISTFFKRSTAVGDRILSYDTNSYQLATGLKGSLLDRFQWDAGFNYGRYSNLNSNYGFLNFSKIFQQIGPSFYADASGNQVASGTPGAIATCGTPESPIPNCTPVNVFGTTGNTLASLGTTTNFTTESDEENVTANISGDLFKLPAGALGAAAGVQYRNLHYHSQPDQLASEFSLSENNGLATGGSYNDREAYLEFHVPVLQGLPLIKKLDLSLGGRYSNYSSFGSNTAGKAALEWRPYSDLLVRATYSDVYRAPTTTELFQGATQYSPSVSDPCNGSDASGQLADGTNVSDHAACAVPSTSGSPAYVDPGYSQTVSQANGNIIGYSKLQPEKGYATDFGVVFDPGFYKPLSVSVDYWIYSLKEAIDTVGLQTIMDACYNDNNSAFCGNAPNGLPYFTRSVTTGEIVSSYEPYLNSNRYYVNGVDTSIKLNYSKLQFRNIDFGRVTIGWDMTYLMHYNLKNTDPYSGEVVASYSDAGMYDASSGISAPRVRGLGYIFWSKGPVSVALQDRFVGNLKENHVDAVDEYYLVSCGTSGHEGDTYNDYGNTVVCNRNAGSANYVDVAGTYAFKRINTDFTVGVTDLFADGAQQMYNSGLAGASNPIYDIRGRSFYGKLVVRFK